MKIISPLVFSIAAILTLSTGIQAIQKPVIAMETVPFFEKPDQGLLPKGYLAKRDTCIADSVFVDSAGMAWFRLQVKSSCGWAQASKIRFSAEIPADFLSAVEKSDEEKKHRGEIIKTHPEWPLRIKKAVRAGQICLDMTADQLVASWGEPIEKRKAFMLGVGEYVNFIYKGKIKGILLVSLQDSRVIGWTHDE